MTRHFLLLAAAAITLATASEGDPWAQPREFSKFQFLMDRSPFSLPTAEESSPLADRFTLTGAVAFDGDALVFVLDKTTQERHMLSKTPNKQSMSLVEYLPNPDPRQMRATIRVEGQIATISYSENAAGGQPPGVAQNPGMMPPQQPNQMPTAIVNPPNGQTVAAGNNPALQQQQGAPQRRVIRRRIISGQPGP